GGTHSRLWIRTSLLRRLRPGPPRSLRLFPRDRDPLPETAISRLAGGNRVAAHSFLSEPAHIAGRDQIASSRIAVLLDRADDVRGLAAELGPMCHEGVMIPRWKRRHPHGFQVALMLEEDRKVGVDDLAQDHP